jgi:hypothetical protein
MNIWTKACSQATRIATGFKNIHKDLALLGIEVWFRCHILTCSFKCPALVIVVFHNSILLILFRSLSGGHAFMVWRVLMVSFMRFGSGSFRKRLVSYNNLILTWGHIFYYYVVNTLSLSLFLSLSLSLFLSFFIYPHWCFFLPYKTLRIVSQRLWRKFMTWRCSFHANVLWRKRRHWRNRWVTSFHRSSLLIYTIYIC